MGRYRVPLSPLVHHPQERVARFRIMRRGGSGGGVSARVGRSGCPYAPTFLSVYSGLVRLFLPRLRLSVTLLQTSTSQDKQQDYRSFHDLLSKIGREETSCTPHEESPLPDTGG